MCYVTFSLSNLTTETDGSVRRVLPTVVQTAFEQKRIGLMLADDEFEDRLFSGCSCTVPGNRFFRLSLGPFGQLC
jgi:hypothetical protein